MSKIRDADQNRHRQPHRRPLVGVALAGEAPMSLRCRPHSRTSSLPGEVEDSSSVALSDLACLIIGHVAQRDLKVFS